MSKADDILQFRKAPDMRRLTIISLVTGVVLLGIIGLVAYLGKPGMRRHFFHGYLVGYMTFFGLTMGCVALSLLTSVVGGRWGEVARPVLATGSRAVPLMGVLFLPLLLGLKENYPWARPEWLTDEIVHQQSKYLNPQFFTIRLIAYFAIWSVLAYVVQLWSRRRDADVALPGQDSIKAITGPSLALYGITITLASVDWVMSTEPRWFSTVFGLLFVAGHGLTGLAFATLTVSILNRLAAKRMRASLGQLVQPTEFGDLGNLLMAFTMLYAYLAFCQFLITWAGNLPGEIIYFTPRLQTRWKYIGLILILFHFALPFFCLFSRARKRDGLRLGRIAAFILVMRCVDWIWMIEPTVRYHTPGGEDVTVAMRLGHLKLGGWIWMDILALLGIGGIWLAFFTWRLGGKLVLPEPAPEAHHGGHHGPHGHAAAAHGTGGHHA